MCVCVCVPALKGKEMNWFCACVCATGMSSKKKNTDFLCLCSTEMPLAQCVSLSCLEIKEIYCVCMCVCVCVCVCVASSGIHWKLKGQDPGLWVRMCVHVCMYTHWYVCVFQQDQWWIQHFPKEGAPTLKEAIIWPLFSQKLHEIERIWTPRGDVHPWHPPLDLPMKIYW